MAGSVMNITKVSQQTVGKFNRMVVNYVSWWTNCELIVFQHNPTIDMVHKYGATIDERWFNEDGSVYDNPGMGIRINDWIRADNERLQLVRNLAEYEEAVVDYLLN